MTMTHTPGTAPAGQSTGPGRRASGVRIAGFNVRLTTGAYILAMLALMLSALSLRATAPGWPAGAHVAAAAGVAVLLIASMIGHELAHAVAARCHGACGHEITVGFLGGRHGRYQLPTPGAQWRTAAAGPAVSLAAAGFSAAAAAGLSALGAGQLTLIVLATTAWINAALGVVNLLPGPGLDGGRMVRAFAWARIGDPVRASLASARTGQFTGAVLAAAGLVVLVLGYIGGLCVGLISLLMIAASRAEARQVLSTAALSGLQVRDILPPSPAPAAVTNSWLAVQAFLDGQSPGAAQVGLAGSTATAFPLRDFDGRPAGILTLSQLAALRAGLRGTTRLSDIATPITRVVTTTPDELLTALLARMAVRPAIPAALYTAGHALVLGDDGALVGVLTPTDIARASQVGALYLGRRTG